MSILFRAPDSLPFESVRYQFIQPMIERPPQLPITVRPVEPDSPPLGAQDAISKAEAFVPRGTSQESGQMPQPSEAKAVTVQKRADLTPPASIPTQPQTAGPAPEPSMAVVEGDADRHSQDWDGDWGRLKNILRLHDDKTSSEGPKEEPERSEPKATKPKPRRLRDVQRRVASGGRYPKPGEKRRAKIEYVSPGDPVTIPKGPAEIPVVEGPMEVADTASSDVADSAGEAGIDERTTPLEAAADAGQIEAVIQRAEESPEGSVEPEESSLVVKEVDSMQESAPREIHPPVETPIQREVLKEKVEEAGEMVQKAAPEAAPDAAPEAAPETAEMAQETAPEAAPDESVDFKEEDEKEISPIAEPDPEIIPEGIPRAVDIAPGDSPAPVRESVETAVQKAEAPAADSMVPDPEEATVDSPAAEAPEIVGEGDQAPSVGLSPGETKGIDFPTPEDAEPEGSPPIAEEVVSTPFAEAVAGKDETTSPVKADSSLTIQREPAETPSEGPSEGYGDQLRAAVQRAEAPPQAPPETARPSPETLAVSQQADQVESEPEEQDGFAQRLFDRAKRLFSREEPAAVQKGPAPTAGPPPAELRGPEAAVVKARLAAPLSAQTFAEAAPALERDRGSRDLEPDISEGEPADIPVVEGEAAAVDIARAEKTMPELPASQVQAVQVAQLAPKMAAPETAAHKAPAVKPGQPATEPGPISAEQPKVADESVQPPVLEDSGVLEPGVEVMTPEIVEEGKPGELTDEPGPALETAAAIERAEEAMPLEEAWPVQRIIPREPLGETDTEKIVSTPADKVDIAQRKTAGRDSSTDKKVDEALRQVAPEAYTDSTIELITPRRPRPELKPGPEQSADEAIVKAEAPVPDKAARKEEPIPDAPEAPVQRLPSSEMLARPDLSPEEAPPITPDQPSQGMVPTGVGDLPTDFWHLLGQQPPLPAPPTTREPGGGTPIQREPSAVDRAVAVAERPALGEVVSQEMDQDVVQKIESRQVISRPRTMERTEVAPADSGAAEEPDIEDLARKVYARLKTKLRIERERSRGRF